MVIMPFMVVALMMMLFVRSYMVVMGVSAWVMMAMPITRIGFDPDMP